MDLQHRLFARRRAAAIATIGLAGGLIGSMRPAPSSPMVLAQDTGVVRLERLRGFAGGGTVVVPGGIASFAFFGERLQWAGGATPNGGLVWRDPAWHGTGLILLSTDIAAYGPVPGATNERELRGHVQVNGQGHQPFVLRATANGTAGSGTDTIELRVGEAAGGATPAATAAAGFSYVASGTFAGGSVALLGPAPLAAGPSCAAIPTP